MRRAIVLALTVGLLAGAVVAPASAAKKKKKPPVTFTAEGSLLTANPADIRGGSVTRQEFLASCGVPVTQGFDGFVIEVDEKIGAVSSSVQVTGSDVTGAYDLDLYFFDEGCAFNGEASSTDADELGIMFPGTKYILVSAFLGAQITFDLEAIEIR